MKAYHFLEKQAHTKMNIKKKSFHGLTQLEIILPAETFNSDEISMITSLLKKQFNSSIISELRHEDPDLNEPVSRDGFMEFLMFRGDPKKENLFAFRESGKVYIFDK